ncbi:hypothetical protein DTO282E5_1254 [Paecilomyces variotii]|nr:hypothetical protein DTO282E5_1254 [Paecilomyces variotii]
MRSAGFFLSSLLLFSPVLGQRDPQYSGPSLEPVHYYFDEWPTGIAVSSKGRLFSNYPLGLDPTNTKYQVAELTGNTTEVPYPSAEFNTPPGGAINYTTTPPTSAGYPDHLISVQSVVIDPKDRLWILDTGRVALPDGSILYSSYGGPKLVGVNLSNNSVFQTILFPRDVAYPESYPNDVRFDLRPNITSSGQGIAYITDSSFEGRNGIIVVDLGTGESWRHLENLPAVRQEPGFFFTVWGEPVYNNVGDGQPITPFGLGSDGITLSADGETLYFSDVGGRYLYSVPTARLRAHKSPTAQLLADGAVSQITQKGVSDGLESDTNGYVYAGSFETNSIYVYFPQNGTVSTFVRDPRLQWTDTFSVAGTSGKGYLYFTENQLWRRPANQGGIDRRVKPFALYRVPLPDNGGKILLK